MGERKVSRLYRVWFFAKGEWFLSTVPNVGTCLRHVSILPKIKALISEGMKACFNAPTRHQGVNFTRHQGAHFISSMRSFLGPFIATRTLAVNDLSPRFQLTTNQWSAPAGFTPFTS